MSIAGACLSQLSSKGSRVQAPHRRHEQALKQSCPKRCAPEGWHGAAYSEQAQGQVKVALLASVLQVKDNAYVWLPTPDANAFSIYVLAAGNVSKCPARS